MFNICQILYAAAKTSPNVLAIIDDSRAISYSELWKEVLLRTQWLKTKGIFKGDRIAICSSNTYDFVAWLYAAFGLGCVVLPLNASLTDYEKERIYNECRVALALDLTKDLELNIKSADVVNDGFPVSTTPDDTALILFTSGSTGKPKGVEITHANLFFGAYIVGKTIYNANQLDVFSGFLPLTHSFGINNVVTTALLCQSTIVLLERFDPEKAVYAINTHHVTILHGVPTMFARILNYALEARKQLPSIRIAISAGAQLPVKLQEQWEQYFGWPIYERYGMTEASSIIYNYPWETWMQPKKGSIGYPVWGTRVLIKDEKQVGDVGELLVTGPTLMKRYLDNDMGQTAFIDGMFCTGDLGFRDNEGRFYLVGRTKEVINRGGYKVYPRELEDELYKYEFVRELCVYGVPDEDLGEEIHVAVVFEHGQADLDDFQAFMRQRIALYKRPRIVHVMSYIPRTESGKIDKTKLPRT